MNTPKFTADVMLGSLGKWLRFLGFDTYYSNSASDHFLKHLAETENRILLTKDTDLHRSMSNGQSYLIEAIPLKSQLNEVIRQFSLDGFKLSPRCSLCNSILKEIAREKVKSSVPPYVFATQKTFSICQHCQKIYWPGTHFSNIRQFIENQYQHSKKR